MSTLAEACASLDHLTLACEAGAHASCRAHLGGSRFPPLPGLVLDCDLDLPHPFRWRPVALCLCDCHHGEQREPCHVRLRVTHA